MAPAAGRSSANTELFIGTMRASVGLFATQAKPGKTAEFDTAGPKGGVLKFESRGTAAPIPTGPVDRPDEPVHSDPLAGESLPALGPVRVGEECGELRDRVSVPVASLVDGEFRRVLVEDGTGAVVGADEVRRGVRLADGSFVDCTDQLAAIGARTKLDRIEVVRCIDSTQVRRERVIGSYYIGVAPQPGSAGPERAGKTDPLAAPTLRLLYEALRMRREVAIVKYTTRSRQSLGVIAPHAKTGTLVLLSLVFAEDFREPPARAQAIARARVSEGQVEAMGELLAALHGRVEDLDDLRDDAIALREELRTRALAGEMADVVAPLPVVEQGMDLEGALVASLDAVRAGKV